MFSRSGFAFIVLVVFGGLIGYTVAAQKGKNGPSTEKAPPPGSPAATTTIDGRYLPPPPSQFGGEINLNASQSKPYWPPRAHGRGRSRTPCSSPASPRALARPSAVR